MQAARIFFTQCCSAALAFLLTACGGGNFNGSGESDSERLAQICSPLNAYRNDALQTTRTGTLQDEKNWVSAYMNERYLWYRDIPQLNPNDSSYNIWNNDAKSVYNYFLDSRSPKLTTSGTKVDKFSFATTTAYWQSFVNSSEQGYGLMWQESELAGSRQIKVAYTYPNSPGRVAGVQRGDVLVSVDGYIASDISDLTRAAVNDRLYPVTSAMHSFVFSRGAGTYTVNLLAQNLSLQQAEYKIIPGTSTGYLLFNSHVPAAETHLVSALSAFKSAGVTDVVLDMRYNGGGYLSVANGLASGLASRPQTLSKVFERIQYSDKRSRENENFYFQNRTMDGRSSYAELGLQKLYVLTTSDTCSASESVINALRGVNVDVELIGSTTCGKPYGFVAQDNCGITYAAMEFEGLNDKGAGGYGDGMMVQCAVPDNLNYALGDVNEPMLRVALARIAGQTCAQAQASSGVSQGRTLSGPSLRSALIRPEWTRNKWRTPAPSSR